MASKQLSSSSTNDNDAKRSRVDGERYEVVLCGDTYIDIDQLFKCPALLLSAYGE